MMFFRTSAPQGQDDQEYMLWLYQNYSRQMLYIAGLYTTNPADREDIVQEALVRLITKVNTLRDLKFTAVASYVNTTVRSVAVDYLRRKYVNQKHFTGDEPSEDTVPSTESNDVFEDVYFRQQIAKVWDGLTSDEAHLLEGKYIMGYSDEELAAHLHCKASSIRMMLTRVRRKALRLLQT